MRLRRARAVAVSVAVVGLLTALAAIFIGLRHLGLDIRIIPDRKVWQPGEGVHGKRIIRNLSFRRVTIADDELPGVSLVDAGGDPTSREEGTTICGGGGVERTPPIVIEPGKSHEEEFWVSTDPLRQFGGWRVRESTYVLTCTWPSRKFNLPVNVHTAAIEFRSRKGAEFGARIIRFAAGGSLTVLRENGLLESFDVATGRRASAIRVETKILFEYLRLWSAFSPDGNRFAILHQPIEEPSSDGRLEVCTLSGASGVRRLIDLPSGELGDASADRLLGFTPDSRSVLLLREKGIVEVDCATGTMLHRNDLDQDDFGGGEHLIGLNGVYLATGDSASFHRYGGQGLKEFASFAKAACAETVDGKRIIFGTGCRDDFLAERPGALEVWSVQTATRQYSIEDDHYRWAAFTSSPARLICGTMVEGNGGALWFSPSFEVRNPDTGALERTLTLPSPAKD